MGRKKQTLANLDELRKAVEALPAERKDIAGNLIKEIVFLETTLESLRRNVTTDGPVVNTESGTKENPALKSYNTTIQRYSLLFKQIVDLLPEPKAEVPTDPLTNFIKQGQS